LRITIHIPGNSTTASHLPTSCPSQR
jgi:hypothetical protein